MTEKTGARVAAKPQKYGDFGAGHGMKIADFCQVLVSGRP